MARAFTASVSLAIVLVAALVVPLTVIPGTFGFQGWPKSAASTVSEDQVQVAPAPSTVAVRESNSRPAARHGAASKTDGPNRAAHAGARPSYAVAPVSNLHGHRQSAALDTPHGTGPGRTPGNHAPAPPAPAQTPAVPPAQPTPAPATVPTPDTVASDEPPVTREEPTANPTPPPPAVTQYVPQQAPPPPAPQPYDQDENDGPGGNGHGNGRGLALGHGHGHGADRD
jgi:hypothetical protein